MFEVGDLIVYATHGICRVDDISEMTFYDMTKTYYILHPIEDPKLTIRVPVDNDSVVMLKVIEKEQAKAIIESFALPGSEWIEKNTERAHKYHQIINRGNREEIARIINTLMRRKLTVEMEGKKLGEADNRMLTSIQKIMFTELSISLNKTFEDIMEQVTELIRSTLEIRT